MMTPDNAVSVLTDCLDEPDYAFFVVKDLSGNTLTLRSDFIPALRALLAGYKAARDVPQPQLIKSFVKSSNDHFDVMQMYDRLKDRLDSSEADLSALRGKIDAGELVERGTCTMMGTEDEGIWECSCGSVWTYEAGTPVDNNVRYCHECGEKVVSVKERRFNPESDEYDEIEIMPQESARAAIKEGK